MSKELQLLTTREFNGYTLDCYIEQEQEHSGDFWATREQIGRLLGYAHPRKSITAIHLRNKERLDKFSRGYQIDSPSGGRQTTTVYNFKGLLEICRYSNQPNANAVIDVLWDIADEIRRTGVYLTDKAAEAYETNPELFRQMLERCSALERRVDSLQKRMEQDQPYSVFGHTMLANEGAITFKDAASFLAQHGIDIGQNRLFKHCREKKLLCSRKGRQWNKPTQKALERGLLNVEISGNFNAITMVTPSGLKHLTDEFMSEQYPLLMLIKQSGEEED